MHQEGNFEKKDKNQEINGNKRNEKKKTRKWQMEKETTMLLSAWKTITGNENRV